MRRTSRKTNTYLDNKIFKNQGYGCEYSKSSSL
jgi:hypothetical protein